MSETIIVIGSNSFSGANFINHALAKGIQVVGISRSMQPHKVFLPYQWSEYRNFEFHQLDINQDLGAIVEVIDAQQPGYVINFAAQGMVAQSWLTPEQWYQTNVLAQVCLHDQLRKFDCIKKYVHVTTPEVYGSNSEWITENFNFSPNTPYAVSRASCDLHLMSFFKAYGFPVVFTRAANVYGPAQQLYRIIPRAMLYARLGRQMELHGGGHSTRSFIHIRDVVDATMRIATDGTPGDTYHISTQKTISIRQLVEKVCVMTGVDFNDLVQISDDRLGKDQAYLLDSTKIRKELNWKDEIELDQGLSETLSWVDENIDILKIMQHDYIHKP